MIMTQKFTKVAGISERRRLPRLGKIRLGVKVISPKTGKEFPREVDYFVVPPEVAKVYGEKPKELDVLFPVNDIDVVFPQAYKWYGNARGLKCIGNGVTAFRFNEETGTMQERECPCELKGVECALRAHLMVILPKVNMGGVYQIDIGSYNSVIDINSGLEYIQALVGRFAMVPLKLRRVEREIIYEGNKRIHYPLQIVFEGDVSLINALREDNKRIILTGNEIALPAPEDINPKFDEDGVVVVENVEQEEDVDEPEIQTAPPAPKAPAVQPTPVVKPGQTTTVTAQKTPVQQQHRPAQSVQTQNRPAQTTQPVQTQNRPAQATGGTTKMAPDAQLNAIRVIAKKGGYEEEVIDAFLTQGFTIKEASDLITAFGRKDFSALEQYKAEIFGDDLPTEEIPEEITTTEEF